MFEVHAIEVTPFQQITRVLLCLESKEAVVVDPGGDSSRILSLIKKLGAVPKQLWLTHSHLDHCGAVQGIKREFPAAVLVAHRSEQQFRSRVEEFAEYYGVMPGIMKNCPEPEKYAEGGEVLSFSRYHVKVLHTPGHSPGHLCYYSAEGQLLLAGDTVFAGTIGRTDLPGGDYAAIMKSIRTEILPLGATTRLLSGHGPDSTLGAELKSNPYLISEQEQYTRSEK